MTGNGLELGGTCNCDSVVDCRGELVAVPCPFDGLVAPGVEPRGWLDEALAEPLERVSKRDLDVYAKLGYCGGLVYARELKAPGWFDAVKPGTIVTPAGRVIGDGEPVLALVALTRRTVYRFKREHGVFPVEWLERSNLLGSKTVVVGSWISSWEANALREKHGLLVVPVVALALGRGGPPPRPGLGVEVALGTGGVPLSPWSLALNALTVASSVYWGRVDAEEVVAWLYTGWRLVGREVRVGRVPIVLVEPLGDTEPSTPQGFLLSQPRSVEIVWV